MKQQILNLKKKLLLVELPEGNNPNEFLLTWDSGDIFHSKLLEVDLIGKITDIAEEQFNQWVKDGSYMKTFWNYLKNDTHKSNQLQTAKDSFFSYLEKEGIYFENPIEKPIIEEYGYFDERDAEGHFYKSYWESEDGEETWSEAIHLWQEAEQKVWNRDNSYIFQIL